ncbi:MAG: hypothetical protein NTW32_16065 [Chloroflexi bacterium]|nr:hypothetical protein [Chloroflexota bacterium]
MSVGVAYGSYQGSMADSDQNKNEIEGMKSLNDGNTIFLTANQTLTQDYAYYDSWYTNLDTNPDLSAYYLDLMSDNLATLAQKDSMDQTEWTAYEEGIFADAYVYFDRSEAFFKLAGAWDEKGDLLQLVVLFMALGLTFAAWASLLKDESNLRPLFAILAIVMLIAALATYFTMPAIPAIEIPPLPAV